MGQKFLVVGKRVSRHLNRAPNGLESPTHGSLNKITSEMKAAIAATGETPLEYMLRVMRDPDGDAHGRDEMSKAAAPYLHPRLARVDQTIHYPARGAEDMSDDETFFRTPGGE
jgi:hypothetical protein